MLALESLAAVQPLQAGCHAPRLRQPLRRDKEQARK